MEFKDWEMDGVGQFFKPFFFLISKAIVLKVPKVYTMYTRPKKRRHRQFFKLIKVVSLQTKEKYSVLGREEKKERF